MGIGITEDHRELARAVRGWAAGTVPPQAVRAGLDSGGVPPFWDSLTEQGLVGLHIAEGYGGGGGDLLDLAVVLEEGGRALLPGPLLPTALASAVLAASADAGGGSAAKALLPRLAAGSYRGAVAIGSGTLTAAPAPRSPGGWRLTGAAPPVLGGATADVLVLSAARGPGGGPGGGAVTVAVDAGTPGLTVREQDPADPTRRTALISADGVEVPADRVIAVNEDAVRDLAAVLFSAEACGIAAWALDTAVEHARTRRQFGRPIGQFQAVKHLCADMLVRVEQARALVWDAARAAAAPPPPAHASAPVRGLTAALAAAHAVEAAFTCAKDCVQILGGIGFTWEHDAHLYLRRATVLRQLLGPGTRHRLRAAALASTGVRRELRLDLPPEAGGEHAAHRARARAAVDPVRGLEAAQARRALAPTGYAAPHLPPPYGLGAGPLEQLAVQQELRDAGVRLPDLGIATWIVPTLIAHGSEEQRERYVLPTLRGDLLWCQLFSEPEAGSDLASLRTRADRTADGGWRVNGQKVWTSAAQRSDHGILLARTDPDAPKHQGLTYFVVDIKNTPGIEIRPLREITGESIFNEVFFDDAPLPPDAVVGEVNGGWRVARNTLGNERVHMADQLTFDVGVEALIERCARADDGRPDDTVRDRVGGLLAQAHALACIGLRTTLQQVSGLEPGAGASIRKLVQTPHQQRVAELALELLGPDGAASEGAAERALHGFLLSRCLTIAGGTTQVQLNVVAERILGLPRDPGPEENDR